MTGLRFNPRGPWSPLDQALIVAAVVAVLFVLYVLTR